MRKKSFIAVVAWLIFLIVIFTVDYPTSLANASVYQLLAFFIPLFVSIFLTLNIFAKSLLRSFIFSFGIILLLILKALDTLNLVTFAITLVAIYLLLGSFKNNH